MTKKIDPKEPVTFTFDNMAEFAAVGMVLEQVEQTYVRKALDHILSCETCSKTEYVKDFCIAGMQASGIALHISTARDRMEAFARSVMGDFPKGNRPWVNSTIGRGDN